MDERKRYEEGMKARRAVLGDAHVDRAQKNRTAFNEPLPDRNLNIQSEPEPEHSSP